MAFKRTGVTRKGFLLSYLSVNIPYHAGIDGTKNGEEILYIQHMVTSGILDASASQVSTRMGDCQETPGL